jgi:homoserine kinase
MQQVTVRVPGSTSNLGPGFDCLGIALQLYNNIAVSRDTARQSDPMVKAAARAFFKRAHRKSFPFRFTITGDVPRSRGLGSSVTVRLGIIYALNELCRRPLRRQDLFEVCTGLEGHPDNAAPAIFGGFNVVRSDHRQSFTVSQRLRFVLLIPNFEVATEKARRILPARIKRLDAVENCRNSSMITAAFASRNYRLLGGSFVDHLHQPFRKKFIPFLDRVVGAAISAGALGGFLSGSGSTICAVTLQSPKKIARAMLAAANSDGARTIITTADNRGARRTLSIRSPQSSLCNL